MTHLIERDCELLTRLPSVSGSATYRPRTTQELRGCRRLVKKGLAHEVDGEFFKSLAGHHWLMDKAEHGVDQ